MDLQSNKECSKCREHFVYNQQETKWVEYGTYSSKIVICPFCGCVNVIKNTSACGLDINNDERYYK